MQIVSSRDMETRRGPEEWFTGDVWLEATSIPTPGAGLFRVLFEPGARTNWHTHPEGQFLYVVTGAGPETFMVHIAITPAIGTEGGTDWMEPVTDEEYAGR